MRNTRVIGLGKAECGLHYGRHAPGEFAGFIHKRRDVTSGECSSTKAEGRDREIFYEDLHYFQRYIRYKVLYVGGRSGVYLDSSVRKRRKSSCSL